MKDQYVIACIDRPEDAATVMPWARTLAERLRHKGLMVINVSADRHSDWLQELGAPYVGLRGQWSTAIEGLPTAFGGILAVVAYDPSAPRTLLANPVRLLREFRNCKIAYLCVPKGVDFSLQQVALTLTHRREGREKLVWASYLTRFCGASLTIAHPDYQDPGLNHRMQEGLKFAHKLFDPLAISFSECILDETVHVDKAAIRHLAPDLLVAMTTDPRDRDFFDLFSHPAERRLMSLQPRIPLLFLNPRDDLYILCD